MLEGFIIAFLNLDRVIDIIRYDDEPKAALMREDWGNPHIRALPRRIIVTPAAGCEDELTEVQAEAILNMRLRSLRRLEEMELLREQRRADGGARRTSQDLLDGEALQWERIAERAARGPQGLRQGPRPAARGAPTFAEAGGGGGRAAGGDDRARADHRRLLEDGLDPRAEGPCRRSPPS